MLCTRVLADDMAGELRCCIAEVTNTPWGDRVAFPFAPAGDLTPKALHVSPLQDMLSHWSLATTPPAETARLDVRCREGTSESCSYLVRVRQLASLLLQNSLVLRRTQR